MLRRCGTTPACTAFALFLFLIFNGAGCDSGRDVAEVHRRLSLRLEHRPPGRADADKDAEIRARIQSSLEQPNLVAWIRVTGGEGGEGDKRIPLELTDSGDALGRIPARHRGETVHYAIEAKDAAGLVVSLPDGARDGRTYSLRFEG